MEIKAAEVMWIDIMAESLCLFLLRLTNLVNFEALVYFNPSLIHNEDIGVVNE